MKIVIGIVTHQRPHQLLRLLKHLAPQLGVQDQICIVENGSSKNNKLLHAFSSSKITFFYRRTASIPQARNHLFQISQKKADVLIFLDDDVIVHPHWLSYLKIELIKADKQHIPVIQGGYKSFPRNNIYAQTTDILNHLWLTTNTNSASFTKVIDTKHVCFFLSHFQEATMLFNPSFKYASDIATAAELSLNKKMKILLLTNITVFHQERSNYCDFIRHRFRLSRAFRKVAANYPGFFCSQNTYTKFQTLWQKLSFHPLKKLWLLSTLAIIYIAVWVSNSITSLRRSWEKFALR